MSREEAMDTSSSTAGTADAEAEAARRARDALVREYEAWKGGVTKSGAKDISLKDAQEKDSGKMCMEFQLDRNRVFTLLCPSNYPTYQTDDNFFVEAEYGLHAWCNALNEYVLDTASILTLSDVLNKGLSLYSSADQANAGAADSSGVSRSHRGASGASNGANTSDEDDDDEDDEDHDMEDSDDELAEDDDDEDDEDDMQRDAVLDEMLEEDLSWELKISRLKKKWTQRDRELRAEKKRHAEATGGDPDMEQHDRSLQQLHHDPSIKNTQPKQVFSKDAAFGILVNDMVTIMENPGTGIEATAVHDNIYQWNVKIRGFAANCVLEKDFEQLKAKFGYDYIELQLDFSMDLYPFFPPLVKVIRPRLQGSMMLRVTTMESLKLTYWNPARNMKDYLGEIKDFLRTWARLDLQSERNDRTRYPDGAYIDIEHHLLRLALVSEIAPRANKKYAVATPPPKAALPASALEPTNAGGGGGSQDKKKLHHVSASGITVTLGSTAAATAASASASHSATAISAAAAAAAASTSASTSPSAPPASSAESGSTSDPGPSGAAAESGGKDKKAKSKFGIFGLSKEKDKDEKKGGKAQKKTMAKGTGYSSNQHKGWDPKQYIKAQKEKDRQIELVLGKIQHELKKLHGVGPQSGAAAAAQQSVADAGVLSDGGGTDDEQNASVASATSASRASTSNGGSNRSSSRRKRKHSPDEVAAAAAVAAASDPPAASTSFQSSQSGSSDGASSLPIDPQTDLFTVLEGSALIPFLESKLRANSFLEINSHKSVYACVVSILREIAHQPYLLPLLGPLPDQNSSLQSLLLALEKQAQVLLDKIGKASANGSVVKTSSPAESARSAKVADKLSEANGDKLAKDFLNLSQEVTQALSSAGVDESCFAGPSSAVGPVHDSQMEVDGAVGGEVEAAGEADGATTVEGEPVPGPSTGVAKKTREDKSAELYKKHMKTLQFDVKDISLSGSQAHYFAPHFQKAGAPTSSVIIRVAQEVSSLATSLPLEFSSSIFVRSDDDKTTLLRAMITGPEGTPYTGGCFFFDIYFPPKYPQGPPHVNFRTTGGGLVRFNPNLYQCGKVCLSLLGTWEGAQGEQWNETSTVLQVLISIQSLILCPEPFYNEPGFDRLYGTPQGDGESHKYSEDVLRNNLKYAILGQLQNPPEGFEEVVRAHFFLKRHLLLKELEKKLETYKSKDVKKLFQEVKRELMKLEQPPNLKKSFHSDLSTS